MTLCAKRITAVLLLIIGAPATASAQDYGYYGGGSLKQRGYYGTPYGSGPQYGSGGGDQYGYGPAYSYAKQAPSAPEAPYDYPAWYGPSPSAPLPCVWRRVWNGRHWVRASVQIHGAAAVNAHPFQAYAPWRMVIAAMNVRCCAVDADQFSTQIWPGGRERFT